MMCKAAELQKVFVVEVPSSISMRAPPSAADGMSQIATGERGHANQLSIDAEVVQ